MLRGMLVHRFGPFEFDPASRRLSRGAKPVRLSQPQSTILTHLIARAGEVVTREALIEAAWGNANINDNSFNKAISDLRKALGRGRGGLVFIETVHLQGYRFAAAVESAPARKIDDPLDLQLAPYRAFVQGQADLETLDRDRNQRANEAFEEVLREAPDYAPAHVGLAMACGLAYEASTVDPDPDIAALKLGVEHAWTGCQLAPASGEAWSALAFVLGLSRQDTDAMAAARKSVDLEPGNWRHWLRLAKVAWGEERLKAADRVLVLCPGLALAHWLKATVFVARGALDCALEELLPGCAAQDAQVKGSPFRAVGLHLLRGLVLAALGRLDDAMSALMQELECDHGNQVYARLCAANTWYAIGAVHLRQRRYDEANTAFSRALAIAPSHASATAAQRGEVPASAGPVERVMAQAIVFARGNRHADAARVCREALLQAPPGPAGWILRVEPVVNPLERDAIWAETLALIRVRAT